MKLRGAEPVGSAFVFLQLLAGQAQGGGQLRLAGAGQLSAQADSMADMNIDGVGGCVGQVGALQEVTYRDEAGALLGRCGAPYSFRRWGAAAQAASNALVAELNPFAPRRSTLILSPALDGKAGRDPCGCLDHQLLAQALCRRRRSSTWVDRKSATHLTRRPAGDRPRRWPWSPCGRRLACLG